MNFKNTLKNTSKIISQGTTAAALALALQQTPSFSQNIKNPDTMVSHTVHKGEALYTILQSLGFSKYDQGFQEFVTQFERDFLKQKQTLLPWDMIAISNTTLMVIRKGEKIFEASYKLPEPIILSLQTQPLLVHPEIVYKTQQHLFKTFTLSSPKHQLLKNPTHRISRILKKRDHLVEMMIKDYPSFDYQVLESQDLIILALMESKLNPKAKSPTGAKGLMQITGVVIEDMKENEKKFSIPRIIRHRHNLGKKILYSPQKNWLFDAGKNFTIGATYLKYLENFSSDTIHQEKPFTIPTPLSHDTDSTTTPLDSLELNTLLDSMEVIKPLLKAKRLPRKTLAALSQRKNFQKHSQIWLSKQLKKMRINLPKKDFDKNFQQLITQLKTDEKTRIKFTIARNYNGDTTMIDRKHHIKTQDIYALKFLYLSMFVFKSPEELTWPDVLGSIQ